MTTMKAITLDPARSKLAVPERRIVELPIPEVGQDEVLVEVHFAGLNQFDVATSKGEHNRAVARSLKRSAVISGIEMAGIARSSGRGVEEGDRVVGYTDIWRGPFYHCQYGATPAHNLAVVPANMSLEGAASIVGGALTSITGLERRGRLEPGQRVLITGATGSVGVTGVQLATHLGADVAAVCHSSQIDFVRAQGASEAYAYDHSEMPEKANQFDTVFDTAPSLSFSAASPYLTQQGRYITTMPHEDVGGFARSLVSRKRWGFLLERNTDSARMERLTELIAAGAFTEVIDSVHSLDDFADAFDRQLRSGKRGKILLDMRPTTAKLGDP